MSHVGQAEPGNPHASTYRDSGTTFTGHVNGSSNSLGGFGLTDQTQGYAWGEELLVAHLSVAEPWHVYDLAAVRQRHWGGVM